MAPGKQDVYDRGMYVIRAKDELIRFAENAAPSPEEVECGPFVVMTEEVPFEEELEGWSLAIRDKCKEAFLRANIEFFPLSVMEKPSHLFESMEVLVAFFDKWWTAERVSDYIEIVQGKWKTRQCDGQV